MAQVVLAYVRVDGTSPYRQWFEDLNPQAAAKVTTATVRMQMGNTSSIKWIGVIGEYRIDWGPGYRIYVAKDGDAIIVLLGGGTKKGQQRDIERAQAMWSEYLARKREGAR